MMVTGTLAFGSGNSWMSVNSNAHLKIQGNLIINGNLNLNSNCYLEFIGSNNTVTITGTVNKGSNIHITGNYADLSGKL